MDALAELRMGGPRAALWSLPPSPSLVGFLSPRPQTKTVADLTHRDLTLARLTQVTLTDGQAFKVLPESLFITLFHAHCPKSKAGGKEDPSLWKQGQVHTVC